MNQTIAAVTARFPIDRLSTWALVGGVGGLLSEITYLPSAVKAFTLLAFVLLGPGSVVLEWFPDLPTVAVRALVPVTGLSVVLLAVSGGLLMGFWGSRVMLLGLAVLTVAGAMDHRRRTQRRAVLA